MITEEIDDGGLARVRAAYGRDPEREWNRLVSHPSPRLEHLITSYALERDLPTAHTACRVLDAGGGPGRYTIELAGCGYRMTLLDLSPGLLDLARQKIGEAGAAVQGRVEAIVEASITDLSIFPAHAFDAVLCLGAVLSHLIDPPARQRAIGELRRVAKPNAPLFLSVMSRLAMAVGAIQQPETWPDIVALRETGLVPLFDAGPLSYCYLPEELTAFLLDSGFETVHLYGCHGLATGVAPAILGRLMADPVYWPLWREMLLATCDQPNVVGFSSHLLAVAR